MSDILACDRGEAYKGSVHLGLFALASVCGAYNAGALCVRPEWRLAANAGLYLALACFEARQVRSHFTASGGRE